MSSDRPSSAGPDDLGNDGPPAVTRKRSTRTVVIGALRTLLIVLVIAAAVWQLWTNWDQVAHTISELQWHRAALSLMAVVVGIACSTMSWQVLLDDLGRPIGVGRGAQIFLVGQLGKYLPGSIWAYVLQIELGHKAGLARARVFAATVFSVLVAIVAALIAGALAIPRIVDEDPRLGWLPWLYLVLPVAPCADTHRSVRIQDPSAPAAGPSRHIASSACFTRFRDRLIRRIRGSPLASC